jgi:hypothetical protein
MSSCITTSNDHGVFAVVNDEERAKTKMVTKLLNIHFLFFNELKSKVPIHEKLQIIVFHFL